MAYGICQRCGWRFTLSRLRTEWTNLKVCSACLDPKPPEMSPPRLAPEGLPLSNASPEPTDYEVTDGEVTEDDL